MATYDISRVSYDPQKHFTSVRMQQGRVLTDDDWNENERIENEETRRTNVDVIGPFGSPDDGFLIEASSAAPKLVNANGEVDFTIHDGTLYLGGLRLVMDKYQTGGGQVPIIEQLETYLLQRDWLNQDETARKAPQLSPNNPTDQFDLVYIEAWQQPVCAVEDAALLETALGGPDTTTRVRNMRQVKLATDIGSPDCTDAWEKFAKKNNINAQHERIRDTRLTVSFVPNNPKEDLCTPSVIGGYLGAENQAIRVQLTGKNAKNEDTFTWGFDNAAPLYRVTSETKPNEKGVNTTTITMLTRPKDTHHYPLKGQIVEILPWSAVLSNGEKIAAQSGFLTTVGESYDPATTKQTLTLTTVLSPLFGMDWKNRTDKAALTTPQFNAQKETKETKPTTEFFYMRVWHRGTEPTSQPQIPFTLAGNPIPKGNTGIAIKIEGTEALNEDFWVIAARPETRNQVSPWALEKGIGPHGVRRFFAPLAIIQWTLLHNEIVVGKIISDCRKPFLPLTEIRDCCECPLPRRGWENIFNKYKEGEDICVCFQSGVYELDVAVILRNKGNIKFTGHGKGSIIRVRGTEAALAFVGCKDILIRDLSVVSAFSGHLPSKKQESNKELRLKEDKTFASYHLNGAVTIQECENIILENVNISCRDKSKFDRREATCLTIKGLTKKFLTDELVSTQRDDILSNPTTVSILNSQFVMGEMQTGILVVNAAKSHIEGNRFEGQTRTTNDPTRPPQTIFSVANQGIVVAGLVAENICIKNNTMKNVLQGIHIATSNNNIKSKIRKKDRNKDQNIVFKAGTTLVSGNNLNCVYNINNPRERHGIFIGNCESLVLNENYVKLSNSPIKFDPEKSPPRMNGIRIFGHYGKRLIVKDNHLEGFGFVVGRKREENLINYGIFIHYLTGVRMPRWWILEANVTENIRIEGVGKLFRTAKMTYADRWRESF